MSDIAIAVGTVNRTPQPTQRRRIALLAIVLALYSAMAAAADAPSQPIWLVSTRSAARCGDLEPALPQLRCWRMDEHGCWATATGADFQTANDGHVPTVVFIHGNRTDADYAVEKGLFTHEVLREAACGRAFRYVIWSWPAERVCRRNNADVQLKAEYSDAESYYLAKWIDQLPPDVPLCLVGHSFGPRIIAGSLQLLAGGEVAGRTLPPATVAGWNGGKRKRLRAVMLAAAIDEDSLAEQGQYDRALSMVDQMLVTCNGRDLVLRWYTHLYGRGGPKALGAVGPCGVDSTKLDVVDVTSSVNRRHDWRRYCLASGVFESWAHYLFLDDAPLAEKR